MSASRLITHTTVAAGLVFVIAAGARLLDPGAATVHVAAYRILTYGGARVAVFAMAAIELCLGFTLLIPRVRRWGGAFAGAYVGAVILVLVASLVNGLQIGRWNPPFIPISGVAGLWDIAVMGAFATVLVTGARDAAARGSSNTNFATVLVRHPLQSMGGLLIAVLALQTLILKQENSLLRHQHRTATRATPDLRSGSTVPAFDVLTITGEADRVDFSNPSGTVLFVFSTECPFCNETLPYWNAAYESLVWEMSIVGVSTASAEETARYVAENAIQFPVCLPTDLDAFRTDFRMRGVPSTIVVGAGGRVRLVERGVTRDIATRLTSLAE